MEPTSSHQPAPPDPPAPPSMVPGEPPPPPRPPTAWGLLGHYLAAFLPLALLTSGLLFPVRRGGGSVLVGLVVAQVFYLLPALAWALGSGFRPLRLLRLARPSGAALLLGAGTGLAVILAGSGVMSLWRSLLPPSLLARFDVAGDLAARGWSPWQLLLVAVFLPALCEEAAFRGGLQTALLRLRSPRVATWGSALVFAAARPRPGPLPGSAAGRAGLRGGSPGAPGRSRPAALAHAINNGTAMLGLLWLDRTGPAEPPERLAPAESGVLLAAGLLVFLALQAAARRWLPPAPGAATFLVPRSDARRGTGPPAARAPTQAG